MVQKYTVKNINKIVRDTASLISHLANCKGYCIRFKPLHHTKYSTCNHTIPFEVTSLFQGERHNLSIVLLLQFYY